MPNIILHRAAAMGDVLLTTGFLPFLEKKHQTKIICSTIKPEIFQKNPHVEKIICSGTPPQIPGIIYNLDDAYELKPKQHIIRSYAERLGLNEFPSPQLFSNDFDARNVDEKFGGKFPKKSIAIHPSLTWENRTWPKEYWDKLIIDFTRNGIDVIVLGAGDDFQFSGNKIWNMNSRLNIFEVKETIKRTLCYIGADTGILHIAQLTQIPIITFFTSTNPEYRIFRKENTHVLTPNLSCQFCLHEEKPPSHYVNCKFKHFDCIKKKILPEQILKIFYERVIKN